MATDDEREIWEPHNPLVAAVFEAAPGAVGVAGVHRLWRRLAYYPGFLAAVWPALGNDLRSAELQAAASALANASFIEEAVGMPSHKAFRGDLVRAEIDAGFR